MPNEEKRLTVFDSAKRHEGQAQSINELNEQLAQYQSKLESLTVTTVLAEERERRRIAIGLHDQVGHSLALAKIKTAALCASVQNAQAQKMIADINRCLDETIKVTRALIFDLSSPLLYQLGLEAALETLGDQVEKRTKLRAEFVCNPVTLSIPERTAVIIYRVVDELVLNVLKHASASMLRICVHRVDNALEVSVEDDGVGLAPFELDEISSLGDRFGLFSIRTQIAQLGGQFHIESSDMGGVRANVTVPIESTDRGADAPSKHRGPDGSLPH